MSILAGTIATRAVLAGDVGSGGVVLDGDAPGSATPGQDGADGADGLGGSPGLDGEDGDQGAPGQAGARGSDGAVGLPGLDGDDGEPGQQGAPGQAGARGSDGAIGLPGLDGDDGEPGQQGARGERGADGLAGAPGADGMDGEDGLAGRGGPAGPQGAQGPPAWADAEDDAGPWYPPQTSQNAVNRDPSTGWVEITDLSSATDSVGTGATYGSTLTFVPLPNTAYAFEYQLEASAPLSTTGIQHAPLISATNQNESATLTLPLSNTTQAIGQGNGLNSYQATGTTSPGSNIRCLLRAFGMFLSHATVPGVFSIGFRTEVAGSTVTVYRGWLRYRIMR